MGVVGGDLPAAFCLLALGAEFLLEGGVGLFQAFNCLGEQGEGVLDLFELQIVER